MIRINLIADRQAKDRLIIQQQIVLGGVILLATLVLCGFWWQRKAAQVSNTNLQIALAKKELDKQKAIRQKVETMEKRERLVNAMLVAIDSLKELKLGPTIYYDNLNMILPPEIWLTSLQDRSGEITLSGYSFSNNAIAQLMKNMERSPQFDSTVDLKEINKAKFGSDTLQKFKLRVLTTLGKKLAEEKRKKEEAAKKAKEKKGKKRKKR